MVGEELLKTVFGTKSHYYDAFPIYNITEKTPPFLLLNAGMDINLKPHTMDFHYALKQANIFVQTTYFDDLSHWNICHDWEIHGKNYKIFKVVNDFIEEVNHHLTENKSVE
jgi:hypothetical protein